MNLNVTVDQIGGHVKRKVEVFKTTPLSKKSLLSKANSGSDSHPYLSPFA
jgi:hypothetical protein